MRLLAFLLACVLLPVSAMASPGMELTYKGVPALGTLEAASIASGDYIPVYDASATRMKKVDATTLPLGGAFNGTIGATTPSTGVFTSIGATLAITDTRAPTADSATTNNGVSVAFTTPVDTTGTNTHNAFNVSPTIGNASGGTNTFNGYNFGAVTGDAQVDVTALRIGTGTRLGTSNAIVIGSGWDKGLDITNSAAADSAATEMGVDLNVTTPIDTTGTNDHWGLNIDFSIGNASGGTNSARGINIANVTGDAQVDVRGISIGTGTTLGTSNAIQIGSGWDAGIVTDSALQVNSTNGTAITAIRFAFDAVASGQTSKTTTLTGVTASSRCVATAAEVATNAVYLRAAVPGTDQVVVTVSADPGASNMDYTVMCMN